MNKHAAYLMLLMKPRRSCGHETPTRERGRQRQKPERRADAVYPKARREKRGL